jgi:uncharacterized protein (TIRG00374 family)
LKKSHWGVLLAIVLVLTIIAALAGPLARDRFRWAEFAAALRTVDPRWALAGTVLALGTYVVRALRWLVMITPLQPEARLRPVLAATVIGFTSVLLFGRPGEVVRPWLIAMREKVPVTSQFAAWFLERIFDLLSVVLLFGFALTGVSSRLDLSSKMQGLLSAAGWAALVAGLGCVVFLLAAAIFTTRTRGWTDTIIRALPARFRGTVAKPLHSFLDGLQSTGSARTVSAVGLWTILEWALICSCTRAIFMAFEPTRGFSWNDILLFTGFVALGSVLQLPGIGGGMQVASVLILTELWGLPLESATACTILVWGVSWLSVVPFGLLAAFMEGLQWRNLRHVTAMETEAVR